MRIFLGLCIASLCSFTKGSTTAIPVADADTVPAFKNTPGPMDVVYEDLHRRLVALQQDVKARVAGKRLKLIHADAIGANEISKSLSFLGGSIEALIAETVCVKFAGGLGYCAGDMNRWMGEVTRQLFSPESGFFVESDSAASYLKINPTGHTLPRANEIYRVVGRFLAFSLMRNRPLGVNLPVMFYAKLMDQQLSLHELSDEEPHLVESLRLLSLLPEELLGQFPMSIDGVDVVPTMENREELVQQKINSLISSDVVPMFDLIKQGFNEVLPTDRVRALFRASELKALIVGDAEPNINDLLTYANITFSNQEQHDWFLSIASGLTEEQVRNLLLFITDLPRVPVGGFAYLEPRITIQQEGSSSPGELLRANVDRHYISIPEYTSQDEMRDALMRAIRS